MKGGSNRNPLWTREELILALDLYFRASPLHIKPNNPQVIELSNFLNSASFHPKSNRKRTFRNPTGVYMTLRSFLKWDPTYAGDGLNGGELGMEVWKEFSPNLNHLSETANAIRAAALILIDLGQLQNLPCDDENYSEGGVLYRLHILKERNSRLIKRKKQSVLRSRGKLKCEVCSFDFERFYGAIGTGFAECHHHLPLASSMQARFSRLSDLAIVCANCHRMLHRTKPWMSLNQLATHLKIIHKSEEI